MPDNDLTPDPTPDPSPAVAGRRKRRRVVRLGVGDENPGRGAEYTEVEAPEAAGDTNDEQLRRDVPPHW